MHELLYTELGYGPRLTARSCHEDVFTAHRREKNGLVTLVDWKHGTWIDGYSCLRLYTQVTQVGCCDHYNPHLFVHLHMYILCNPLIVYFVCKIKNKPNGGIAFPAFFWELGWSNKDIVCILGHTVLR